MKIKYTLPRLIAATSAILLLPCLTACGDSDEDTTDSSVFDSIDFSGEEDLEYGATLRESDEYAIPIEYDRRFFDEEQLTALINYYVALENDDLDLFNEVTLSFYNNYYIENAYGGLLDTRAYLAELQKPYTEEFDDFTFASLSITSCINEDDVVDEESTTIPILKDMFDTLEGDGFCDTYWEGCQVLSITPIITDGTQTITCDTEGIFLVKLDGDYYICS